MGAFVPKSRHLKVDNPPSLLITCAAGRSRKPLCTLTYPGGCTSLLYGKAQLA